MGVDIPLYSVQKEYRKKVILLKIDKRDEQTYK